MTQYILSSFSSAKGDLPSNFFLPSYIHFSNFLNQLLRSLMLCVKVVILLRSCLNVHMDNACMHVVDKKVIDFD